MLTNNQTAIGLAPLWYVTSTFHNPISSLWMKSSPVHLVTFRSQMVYKMIIEVDF